MRTIVGTDYVLEKLPDVSGPGLVEAGRYRMVSEPTHGRGFDRRGRRSLKGVRM